MDTKNNAMANLSEEHKKVLMALGEALKKKLVKKNPEEKKKLFSQLSQINDPQYAEIPVKSKKKNAIGKVKNMFIEESPEKILGKGSPQKTIKY